MPFKRGDVVVRTKSGFSKALDTSLPEEMVGTICRVVTAGSLYSVRYKGASICVQVYESSLRKAPNGTVGPACLGDC